MEDVEQEKFEINVTNDEPLHSSVIDTPDGEIIVAVLETDQGHAIILQTQSGIAVVDLVEEFEDARVRAVELAGMFEASILDEEDEDDE